MRRLILAAIAWLHRGLKRSLDLRTPGCEECERLGRECVDCWGGRQV